jgi:hypothetical protein
MGKSIEDLFKTKQLVDGKTAAEKYEIRNSKDIILRSSTGAMDLPFKAAQILRRNLSSRTRETRLEQEVTGLRIISKLAGPVIYGTDIFKLSTQKTEMVSAMKDSVNPNNSADSGLLGNLFQKGKEKGLELLNKIGVQLPTKLIPTRISLNKDFKAGKEPDTMATLAKIKQDGAGNLMGKFLAQNAKGTPKQIGNQVLGGGIGLLKGEVKKKLFGAPKQGAQNLAKKGDSEVQYDSSARYSDTVNPIDEDYLKRNDLSSILVEKNTKDATTNSADKPLSATSGDSKATLNASKNPFASLGDKLKDAKKENEQKLSQAAKQGQQEVSKGKTIGDTKSGATPTAADATIKYSETVDEASDDIKLRNDLSTLLSIKKEKEEQNPDKKEQIDKLKGDKTALNVDQNPFAKSTDKIKSVDAKSKTGLSSGRKVGQQSISDGTKKIGDDADTPSGIITYSDTVDEIQTDIKLRNDLSTKLEALINASNSVSNGNGIQSISRNDVSQNMYSNLKNQRAGNAKPTSLKTRYGIESKDKLDFLNEKTTYKITKQNSENGSLKLADGTLLDDYDFVTLKFSSKYTGETANFRATVTGISETVSPSWDTAKFIGSPFNYYTYSSIERSVSFNFKIYSTTPLQHIAAWQRINFLTGLTYPQGYSGPYAVPPFVVFTLGSLYKNKVAYIESLSYTMDDTAGWEIGSIGVGEDARIDINGDKTIMKNYKCPVVVDVSITLKLVESKGNTSGRNYYGFDRLPRTNKDKSATNEASPSDLNAQKFDDANTDEGLVIVEPGETMNQNMINTKKDDNKNAIKVEQPISKAKGPEFDAFGRITNEGQFARKKSTGPEFDAFGNITNEGQF